MIIVDMLIYRRSDDEAKRADAISIINQENERNKQYTLSKCQEFVLGNQIETVLEFRQYGFDSVFSSVKIDLIMKYRNWLIKAFRASNT